MSEDRKLFLVAVTLRVHPQLSPTRTETVSRLVWAETAKEAQQKVQKTFHRNRSKS